MSPRSARVIRAAAERRATKVAEMRARAKVVAIQSGDLSNVLHQQAHTYRATFMPGTNVAIYALDARSNKHVYWACLQGFDEHLNVRLLWWEQRMDGHWHSTYEETLPPTALLGVADPGHAPHTYLWMLPLVNHQDRQQDRQVHGRALALSERIRREQEYQEEREAQRQSHLEAQRQSHLEAQEAKVHPDLVARRRISFLQRAHPFLSARDALGGSLSLLPFRQGRLSFFHHLFTQSFSSGRADPEDAADGVQHHIKKEEIGGI